MAELQMADGGLDVPNVRLNQRAAQSGSDVTQPQFGSTLNPSSPKLVNNLESIEGLCANPFTLSVEVHLCNGHPPSGFIQKWIFPVL